MTGMGESVRWDVRRKLELWADPPPPVDLRENWPVDDVKSSSAS